MHYDESKALKVLNFIEDNLVFTAGVWAGQPFRLMDWQWEKVIAPLFGTLKHKGGPRQYRTCYLEIGKKNGKTQLSAAIMLYMLEEDDEQNPMCYSAASDKEQATLVFEPAAYMVQEAQHPKRFEHLKVLKARRRIVNYRGYGFYQVLSSDVPSKHGMNPSFVAIDELHAHKKDELFNVLTSGTDYARQQQIVLITTTAGIFDKNSIWWRTREKARQIEKGIVEDDTFLPVLFIADVKDDPEDRKVWRKVNPSLGTIFTMEKIEQDFKTAKQDPVAFQNFKRFRLNIPIRQVVKWIPMDKWDKCGGKINQEELLGRRCYGGFDASTNIDLTAFILDFPPEKEEDKHIILAEFFVPEDTIIKRSKEDRVNYDIWEQKGYINATPGNAIDQTFIRQKIKEASKKYILESVGFDRKDAGKLALLLQDEEAIKMVEIIQTWSQFSEPSKDLLTAIIQNRINHGDHPVLRWCADNLVMKIGMQEDVLPSKTKAVERIDGMVALIMAWKMMMIENTGPYEDYDLKVLR